MSHTRVKTIYTSHGIYGSEEIHTLYCHHNHSSDFTTFYDESGQVSDMCFSDDSTKWDAMMRLWFPFKGEWGGELKDGVDYSTIPKYEGELEE